ncbi:MAG: hypothetical protein R3E66_08290 [bacterium]
MCRIHDEQYRPTLCGNRVLDPGETCDGNCPTTCNSVACVNRELVGEPQSCNVVCQATDVVACTSNDGCCPQGCTQETDDDCSVNCGNQIVDPGETCDRGIGSGPGACIVESSCTSNDACMIPVFKGSVSTCNTACVMTPVQVCQDDDGCCPTSCDRSSDNDCKLPSGSACTTDEECQLGVCIKNSGWDDGYCSGSCRDDAECGPNGHCNGRACMAKCATNSDCRSGYECRDFFGDGLLCAPRSTFGKPGTPCTDASQCVTTYFDSACLPAADGFVGGYCSTYCISDADCPGGSFCVAAGDTAMCMPNCQGDNDCRPGYQCFPYGKDPRSTCAPAGVGTGLIGQPCDVVQDCAGGPEAVCINDIDWTDGYCTLTECLDPSDCPTGSACVLTKTGEHICAQSCETTSCRDGYECVARFSGLDYACLPSGVGTAQIGEPCANVATCASGQDAICINETQGWKDGYCTEACSLSCGNFSLYHCAFYDTASAKGLCVQNCSVDADCRADGYGCDDRDNDGVKECVPSGTGTGTIGSACAGRWECAGGVEGLCLPWPGGYCITSCTNDAVCGAGAHCGFVDSSNGIGSCASNCAADTECRVGYACYDADNDGIKECVPLGTRAVGQPCNGFQECDGRERAACVAGGGFKDGYCLQDCSQTNTCPIGSTCIPVEGNEAYCFKSCLTDTQCRDGYRCKSPSLGQPNVCYP